MSGVGEVSALPEQRPTPAGRGRFSLLSDASYARDLAFANAREKSSGKNKGPWLPVGACSRRTLASCKNPTCGAMPL
eukprot:6817382-Alexandrium_andersonii.AAC.1